jgi:hypothetical protein
MIGAMERIRFPKSSQVQTDPRIQRAYRRAVQTLAERLEDDGLTMQEVTNAFWLWFAERDPAELAKWLGPKRERLAELMGVTPMQEDRSDSSPDLIVPVEIEESQRDGSSAPPRKRRSGGGGR